MSHESYVVSQLCHPTQSIMYVPLQVNRFQKSILRIVQYKYLKSYSRDFILQNLILRTRSCGSGFITLSNWVFHFQQTTLVRWKCFVPQLYQFRRGILGGQALKYFYMIHRGRRIESWIVSRCMSHKSWFHILYWWHVAHFNELRVISCVPHMIESWVISRVPHIQESWAMAHIWETQRGDTHMNETWANATHIEGTYIWMSREPMRHT